MLTLLFNYLTFLTIKFICWIDENINCTFILFSDINENSDERTRQKHELIKSHMIPSAIKDARMKKREFARKVFQIQCYKMKLHWMSMDILSTNE